MHLFLLVFCAFFTVFQSFPQAAFATDYIGDEASIPGSALDVQTPMADTFEEEEKRPRIIEELREKIKDQPPFILNYDISIL